MAAVAAAPVTTVQRVRLVPGVDQVVTRVSSDDERRVAERRYAGDLADLQEPHKCLLCLQQYVGADNLIARQCHVHLGRVNTYATGRQAYSCCGKSWNSEGCTSCMHVWREGDLAEFLRRPFETTLEIPVEIFELHLVAFSPEIIDDAETGGSYSRTLDKKTLRQARQSGQRLQRFYHISRLAKFPPRKIFD